MSIKELALIALFAALTAILAYVYLPIPISPVPITGQTMGVMLAGALLGAKKGFISQIVYLLIGIAGFPVFAGGFGGITTLVGPTGGYLLSYPFAAYIIGILVERVENKIGFHYWTLLISTLTLGGMIVIYIPGVIQMALITQIPISLAILEGVVPFLIGDIAKVIATAFVVRSCHALAVKERFSL
ncbi:biotin transporter BioY [Natranaerobius trueperi]|uniref:Biotin transporter n=2 Tax=Natranaerobius trueperi TaxID=759412 RepID=A0A226C2D7_9FIRM|nr:biotin transporter BioY [Natranaerobius trueperi]